VRLPRYPPEAERLHTRCRMTCLEETTWWDVDAVVPGNASSREHVRNDVIGQEPAHDGQVRRLKPRVAPNTPEVLYV
jgi:hypothetical protein